VVAAVRVTVVRPRELGQAECDRWRELQSADLCLQTPFLSPAFARAVDTVTNAARVAVVQDGRTIVGFLPFELTSRGVGTAIGRKLNTRQGFIHEPGLVWSWTELLGETGLDVLELQDVVGVQAVGTRTLVPGISPVIDTRGGWQEYLAAITRHKSVKTILYKERRMRRDREDVTFASGPASDCTDLARLIAWKSQQYRRSGWPDLFARRETVALLGVLAEGTGEGLRAVGSSLRIGGRVVATDMSLATDTVFAGWFAAHDPSQACHSPGAIRTLRTVEAAFQSGARCIDLSRGDERYKDALTNDHSPVSTGFVSRQSVRSLAYQAGHRPKSAITGYVLAHPGVRSLVRQSLRRVGEARERCAALVS
jgi:CelD/BcsL family acetyltransferase involved in cellulose biosynthesis